MSDLNKIKKSRDTLRKTLEKIVVDAQDIIDSFNPDDLRKLKSHVLTLQKKSEKSKNMMIKFKNC